MARIILPDPSRAFGPRTPPVQKFWQQKPQEPSGEERALRIIQAIGIGTKAAAGLYGIGRHIYQAAKETPEEAVARLQGEAVKSRAEHWKGPTGPQELTALRQRMTEDPQDWDPSGGAEMAERAARARAQAPVAREEMTRRLVEGVSPRRAFAPLEEPPSAPTADITPESVLEEAIQDGIVTRDGKGGIAWTQLPDGSYDPRRRLVWDALERVKGQLLERDALQQTQPALEELTPARRNKLQEWMAAVEPEDRPHLVAKVREAMGLDRALDQTLTAYGWSRQQYDELNENQKRVLHVQAQRMDVPEQRTGTPVTAGEFVERARGGSDFTISDLAESYGALIAAGQEAQARDLLQIARGAMDYASFITSEHDVPALVEARARNAIKSGGRRAPAKQVKLESQTLRDVYRMKDKEAKKKKKGGGDGPTPPGRETTTIQGVTMSARNAADPHYVLLALAKGTYAANRIKVKDRALQVKRIQETPGSLDSDARAKLDAWNPGWKTRARPAAADATDRAIVSKAMDDASAALGLDHRQLESPAMVKAAVAKLKKIADRTGISKADVAEFASDPEMKDYGTSDGDAREVTAKYKKEILKKRKEAKAALIKARNAIRKANISTSWGGGEWGRKLRRRAGD